MSETRILKWVIPVDDQEHKVKGEFLHAEPMTDFEREQAGHVAARGDGPTEWVTIWTRVGEGPGAFMDNPSWRATFAYRVFGTGQSIESADEWSYAGTVRQPEQGFTMQLVWHIMNKAVRLRDGDDLGAATTRTRVRAELDLPPAGADL